MSDRRWMALLTESEHRALVWCCVFCGKPSNTETYRSTCTAPDGDGHIFDPVKPAGIDLRAGAALNEGKETK